MGMDMDMRPSEADTAERAGPLRLESVNRLCERGDIIDAVGVPGGQAVVESQEVCSPRCSASAADIVPRCVRPQRCSGFSGGADDKLSRGPR